MEDLICPYPGLRPFNEEEAIFFKGRDEHIEQITRQLEEKKFLMLTGASGDGKSSLVYAGLIPNARAGFFKAKFNNWIVVDFRPERTPLKNLADALSDKFGALEKERFQNELKFGFSALIDIYTQSPFYIDKNSPSFLALDEAEKKKAIRKGANLMILVDQFEEFFTNKENYTHGISSVDSQLVVNLILETSKIALEKDIPIYCVCTMRSDYIGQCASFRGLPEAIGFSQFFVPRLKRKEIYQVIQEPALLNGNKITKRLTEVLISEMDEGIDQLPVLQHALNQIWQIADKGNEEMDLIHFAKIGGIKKDFLTPEDEIKFNDWFQSLPEYKKNFFAQPSLDNVLDAHANDLFYRAYDYLKTKYPAISLSEEDAFTIIRTTFKCLTKIDQSRGVRNRMTLNEIVHIIDHPQIGEKEVAGILEIFRLQGNTFIKPFYTEDTNLSGESVLDITHESLIRNWNNLITWAEEENADYLVWLDFEKQLQRWLKDNKSSGYLLPIGPLNFFETWMDNKKPNKYWLLKYDDRDLPYETKLKEADELLKNALEFIRKSARKLFISRIVLKYGAKKVAYVISAFLVVVSCWYLYGDYDYKQNHNVLARGEERGLELLESPKVNTDTKAQFILLYDNSHPDKLIENLKICGNDSVQLRVAFDIFKLMGYPEIDNSAKKQVNQSKLEIIRYLYSLFKEELAAHPTSQPMSYRLANRFYSLSSLIAYATPLDSKNDPDFGKFQNQTDDILYNHYIKPSIENADPIRNIDLFHTIVQQLLGHVYDHKKILYLAEKISPYFSDEAQNHFNSSFSKKQNLAIENGLTLKFNGGYELIASLYAYLGEEKLVFQSIDSIMKYDDKFYERDLFGTLELANCHWLGSTDSTHSFILSLAEKRWAKLQVFDPQFFIDEFSHRNLWDDYSLDYSHLFFYESYSNDNYNYFSYKYKRDEIYEWMERRNREVHSSENEKHFHQANFLKYRAIEAFENNDSLAGQDYMMKFKEVVDQLDLTYLDDSIYLSTDSPLSFSQTTRKSILFFPSYVDPYLGWNYWDSYTSSAPHILSYFSKWNVLSQYNFNDAEISFFLKCVLNDFKKIPVNLFNQNEKFKETGNIQDFLILIQKSLKDEEKKKELELLIKMMETVDLSLLFLDKGKNLLDEQFEKNNYLNENYFSGDKEFVEAKLIILKIYQFKLIRNGYLERAMKFLEFIPDPIAKNNLRLDLCNISLKYGFEEIAITILQRYIRDFNPNKRVPSLFFKVVGHLGGQVLIDYAYSLVKDSDETHKPVMLKYLIKGMVLRREFYTAMSIIPANISSDSELQYINELLSADFIHNSDEKMRQEKYWLTDLIEWGDQIYETNSIIRRIQF